MASMVIEATFFVESKMTSSDVPPNRRTPYTSINPVGFHFIVLATHITSVSPLSLYRMIGIFWASPQASLMGPCKCYPRLSSSARGSLHEFSLSYTTPGGSLLIVLLAAFCLQASRKAQNLHRCRLGTVHRWLRMGTRYPAHNNNFPLP